MSHPLRTWFPTSVNGRRVAPGTRAVLRPWGTVHVRAIGSTVTLCGEPAATWPIFFDLAFRPGHPSSCERCRARMSSVHRA